MCQRLNTGESNNFYFGIFICIGPLICPLFYLFFTPDVDVVSLKLTAAAFLLWLC